jgi:hypothetical protein
VRVAVGYELRVDRGVGADREGIGCAILRDNKLYERQIEATDDEIDTLMYELYGSTEEEIAIVEGRDT